MTGPGKGMAVSGNSCIGVLPIGAVPEIAPKVIAANVSGYLNLPAEVLPPIKKPDYAFDARRLQYDAGRILTQLETLPFDDHQKIIAVLNVDLFVPIFTYVFGEARQGGKCALVSLVRIGMHVDGSTPPKSLLNERAAKVGLHELGHLFGLLHCDDGKCLMHFSGGLGTLDRLPLYFCRYCRRYFHEALMEYR